MLIVSALESRYICLINLKWKLMNANDEREKSTQNAFPPKTQKFETLFEVMTNGLLLHDIDGTIFKANNSVSEYLNLPKETLETMNISDLIPEDIIKAIELKLRKLKENKPLKFEINFVLNTKGVMYFEVITKKIILGKKEYLLSNFRDITQLKTFEAGLKSSKLRAEDNEHELNAIFNNAPYSMILFDENMKILRANTNALTNFLINKVNLPTSNQRNLSYCLNTNHISFTCANSDTCTNCELANAFNNTILKGKHYTKVEMQMSLKIDNNVIPKTVSLSTALIKKNGHSVYLAILDDITERKILEQELMFAKDKAEESDKLKTAFLNNLNHELRTPLNGILGFIDLIVDENYKFSMHEKKEFIDIMHKSSDRLLNTVNDLVEISKLDCGIIEIHKEIFEVKNEFESFIKEQQLKLCSDKVDFSYEIDSNLTHQMIYTDKFKTFKVIANILENAFKFTPQGFIKLNVSSANENLIVSIEDSGIGIDPKNQNLIFKPFWQVEKDMHRAYEGNGLGLTVAQKIIKNLAGSLFINSRLEKGTTFVIHIPGLIVLSTATTPLTLEPISYSNVSLAGKTILVAEDEFSNYLYIEAVLEDEGCKLLHANNGFEAVEMFKATPTIDLVLMDINMPILDGYEAALKIKEINPKIPIIGQSAYNSNSEKQKALDAGCNDYITKPIKKEDLIMVITHVLNTT